MIELLCAGINTYNICVPVEGIRMKTDEIILPKEYKDWTVEKAIYSFKEDKIFVQISYNNLRRVLML